MIINAVDAFVTFIFCGMNSEPIIKAKNKPKNDKNE